MAGAPLPGGTVYNMNPERFHEYMFIEQLRKDGGYGRDAQHPMRLNSGPLKERYTDEVDTRVAADLASGLARPTKEEHLVARLSLLPDRSEDEASIAAALNEALRWGRPMEGAKLQQERAGVLQGLGSAGDIDRWSEARDLLARLYRSHTYREIRALADPERDLPATMLPIDDAARRGGGTRLCKICTGCKRHTVRFFVDAAHAAAWSGDYRRPLDERWARNVDVIA